jgi:hypothetical protein
MTIKGHSPFVGRLRNSSIAIPIWYRQVCGTLCSALLNQYRFVQVVVFMVVWGKVANRHNFFRAHLQGGLIVPWRENQ